MGLFAKSRPRQGRQAEGSDDENGDPGHDADVLRVRQIQVGPGRLRRGFALHHGFDNRQHHLLQLDRPSDPAEGDAAEADVERDVAQRGRGVEPLEKFFDRTRHVGAPSAASLIRRLDNVSVKEKDHGTFWCYWLLGVVEFWDLPHCLRMEPTRTRFSLAEARASFATLLARAALGGERFRLARRGIDVAAIVGARDLNLLANHDAARSAEPTWDQDRPKSPRIAREQLADKLAAVEDGSRVAIEKRGRLYAGLIPIEDLNIIEARAAAVGPMALLGDTVESNPNLRLTSATVSALLVPGDDTAAAIVVELKVTADAALAPSRQLPQVRCATTPRPKNHEEIVEAIRSAALQHGAFGPQPSGFTYELSLSRSRDSDNRSLADVTATIAGASVQAAAFLAAAFAMLGFQAEPNVLATGPLEGTRLGSLGRKIQGALDGAIHSIVIPEPDLDAAIAALSDLGLTWNEHEQCARGGSQAIRLLTFDSAMSLYDLARHLSGEAATAEGQPVEQPPSATPSGSTIEALWREALGRGEGSLGALEGELIEHLRRADTERPHAGPSLEKPLTLLQQEFLRKSSTSQPGSGPAAGARHLLISGGTSSGKTTLTEVLSVAVALAPSTRNRVLYIAPTRALAQLRYLELQERYGTFRPLSSAGGRPIILATGEDNQNDWRFRTADFSIAVLVYEKANVLAQIQRSLLDKIGLVVVDEAHMLADFDRGPMLEMFLLKAIHRRSEQERAAEDRDNPKLRIAVISTEAIQSAGANSPPLIELLTETKILTGERLLPLVVSQPYRPGRIAHHFVMPYADAPGHYRVQIAEFADAASRSLPPDAIAAIERRIQASEVKFARALDDARRSSRFHNLEPSERLYSLLIWLRQKYGSTSRRILVFMPSVREIIATAGRLKNSTTGRASNFVDPSLRIELDALDDAQEKKHFLELAQAGIFIHHAGVDRQLRDKISDLWSNRDSQQGVEILLATETLSFGVNLSVDDVVMYGTRIYTAPRNRNKEGISSPYSTCEFHNMIGRAGRLGLTNADEASNVYVLPTGEDQAREVLRRYYFGGVSLESNLFVEDDVVVDRSSDVEKHLNNISHSFVHSILDLLRFSAPLESDAASVDELMEALDRGSLFCKQIEGSYGAAETRRRLRQSIETVLEGCAAGPDDLRLVTKTTPTRPARYRISQKGRDVLDTGTEIQTLAPLTRLTTQIEQTAWSPSDHSEPMPAQLALLAVIAQRECFRSIQKAVPEARLEQQPATGPAEGNAVGVFSAFASTLQSLVPGTSEATAQILSDEIFSFCQTQGVARPELRRDSILRVYTMMLLWIDGRRLPEARKPVEILYPRADQRQFSVNINSFAERLAWKLELLARLLAPRHEPYLADLVQRVRLGCPSQAIALLEALPRLKRTKATAMVTGGFSPDDILRRPDIDLGGHLEPASTQRLLRANLKRDAARRFNELIGELCSRPGAKLSRQVDAVETFGAENLFLQDVQAMEGDGAFVWPTHLRHAIEAGVDHGGWSPDGEMMSFEDAEDHGLWSGGKNGRHLQMTPHDEGAGGYLLIDHEDDEEPGDARRTRLLTLGIRTDWSAVGPDQVHSRSLADILTEECESRDLIIGVAPWLPHSSTCPEAVRDALRARRERGQTTAFATTPALCVLLTLLGREFEGPDALIYDYLRPGQTNVITVRSLREKVVEVPEFPGAIRRALAKFSETGCTLTKEIIG